METRDEVLSSVGARDIVTSGYQVSDLDNVDVYWVNDQLASVFNLGIDTPFSSSTFNNFEMSSMVKNPILVDKKEDKENSPPHPSTPISEGPTETPLLMRRRPCGTRVESVPDYVSRNLFE